jgi:hypothetical protein
LRAVPFSAFFAAAAAASFSTFDVHNEAMSGMAGGGVGALCIHARDESSAQRRLNLL